MKAIYIISNNIDNRVYIGSAINVNIRFYHHKRDLRRNKHHNYHLQKFYNKYGKDSLNYKVLEQVKNSTELINKEQFYIDLYPNKFNICLVAGNSLNRKCSEETKIKISNSLKNAGLKGIKKSNETKRNMSKPKSKTHILNIKLAQEKVIKKVYQYNLNYNLISEHRSVTDAAKNCNVNRKDISAVCNKRQKTANNFIWSFTKL